MNRRLCICRRCRFVFILSSDATTGCRSFLPGGEQWSRGRAGGPCNSKYETFTSLCAPTAAVFKGYRILPHLLNYLSKQTDMQEHKVEEETHLLALSPWMSVFSKTGLMPHTLNALHMKHPLVELNIQKSLNKAKCETGNPPRLADMAPTSKANIHTRSFINFSSVVLVVLQPVQLNIQNVRVDINRQHTTSKKERK